MDGVAAVDSKFHDAILAAMDNLVISRVELAISSANASPKRNPSNVLSDQDQGTFQETHKVFIRPRQTNLSQT